MDNIKKFETFSENTDSIKYYLDELKKDGLDIADNRQLGMGFSINGQKYEFIQIVASDKFGISTSGIRTFEEDTIEKYKNELEEASNIIDKLNSKI